MTKERTAALLLGAQVDLLEVGAVGALVHPVLIGAIEQTSHKQKDEV